MCSLPVYSLSSYEGIVATSWPLSAKDLGTIRAPRYLKTTYQNTQNCAGTSDIS